MAKVFYVIGTGPSINDITDEQWKYLEDKNTISFGGFPFSGIKTKYYFCWETDWFDHSMIHILDDNNYRDTILLLTHPNDIELANSIGFKIIRIKKGNALFCQKGWFTDEDEPPHPYKFVRGHSFDQGLFRFRGSLSAVINASLILGAEEIRLIGIDLKSAKDFYDDTDKWIKKEHLDYYKYIRGIQVGRQEMKEKNRPEMFKTYDMSTMHDTAAPYKNDARWPGKALRGVIDSVPWMDRELRKEGHKGIYICNKDSALYDKIEYKEIIDAIHN